MLRKYEPRHEISNNVVCETSNEATSVLFKSEKKTNEGLLKQMSKGLKNNFCFYLALNS